MATQAYILGQPTVTIKYAKIASRDPRRKSWGFLFSDLRATFGHYSHYVCSRTSAKRTYEKVLKPQALERGYLVVLEVDPESGLTADLSRTNSAN